MIGIDEVGRGCWAGPLLVVAARQTASLPAGLADSKVVSKVRRAQLVPEIAAACQIGEGWVEPAEIDQLGLTAAMCVAVERALDALQAQPDELIIMDGNYNYCPASFRQVQCMVNADADHPIVSAASIHAKVARDAHMAALAKSLPGYGFEKHVGYGTKAHLEALKELGVSTSHRRSYKPVQALL